MKINFSILTTLSLLFQNLSAQEASLFPGQNGYSTTPLFTVGEAIGDYRPPGVIDGLAAYQQNEGIYVLANHELGVATGGFAGPTNEYTLKNGTNLPGARISYFRINKESRKITEAGIAFNKIINRAGKEVTDASDLVFNGLSKLCSAFGTEPGQYGFVDRIYLTGEETPGGSVFALDVDEKVLWAAPALGVGKWENAVPLDLPELNKTHVIVLLGDDTPQAPLYLYAGEKNQSEDASFLDRNGLGEGKLYIWKSDDNSITPENFKGTGATKNGVFILLDNHSLDPIEPESYDELGYAKPPYLKQQQISGGAFQFSRPEDLAANPNNGSQLVYASTGGSSAANGDFWGMTYLIDVNITIDKILNDQIEATLQILFDGNDYAGNGLQSPQEGLRNPDNLCWSSDGFIYIQEDRAVFSDPQLFGGECSIWKVDPKRKCRPKRIAQADRSAIPSGMMDVTSGFPSIWESSGIIDVSELFEEEPGSLFLFDVQAHGIRGGAIDSYNLGEGGQLLFLKNDKDPKFMDADCDGLTNHQELVVYGSNPNKSDTDSDGISDGVEVEAGLDVNKAENIADAVRILLEVRNTAISERNARPTFEELKDGRLGSVILLPDVTDNKVRLRFCIEESNGLGQWITREEEAEVDIPLAPGKKFFRFSVKENE